MAFNKPLFQAFSKWEWWPEYRQEPGGQKENGTNKDADADTCSCILWMCVEGSDEEKRSKTQIEGL